MFLSRVPDVLKLLHLGGGLTTGGTPLKVGLEADRLYIAAKRTMEYIQQNDATIRRRIASRVGLPPIVMDFHLELTYPSGKPACHSKRNLLEQTPQTNRIRLKHYR